MPGQLLGERGERRDFGGLTLPPRFLRLAAGFDLAVLMTPSSLFLI